MTDFFALLFVLAIVAIIVSQIKLSKLKKELIKSHSRNSRLETQIQDLETFKTVQQTQFDAEKQDLEMRHNNQKQQLIDKIDALSKFQNILDINLESIRIVEETYFEKHDILANATEKAHHIENDAKEFYRLRRDKANKLIDESNAQLTIATREAKKIIDEAKLRAQEIAGDAYIALENADHYEKAVKAMKNIIEGYGDEYLKPTFSVLDDLSEEFSHTDAGQQLKVAREKSNSMVRNGIAARCSYVESYRRRTAIEFVLDAFNGKVDSILSKVKKDNFGVLEQKIKDAFYIVNNNGKAFRAAHITDEYLTSRLSELKWAVVTQELKWQEREEQRQIREQIREEERAKREYEKAIKEAEKEERILRKLIKQAEEEVAKSTLLEREKHLEKLFDLETRLKEAELKNERALSMAQQTKAGNVYIISNIGSFGEEIFKIGMTRRLEPLDRIRELGDASVPFEFDVHAMIYSDNAPQLERSLHKRFLNSQLNKVNPRKEFFNVSIQDIQSAVDELGLTVKWTLAAEAKQYRESIALSIAIENDKALENQWKKFQHETDDEEIIIDESINET